MSASSWICPWRQAIHPLQPASDRASSPSGVLQRARICAAMSIVRKWFKDCVPRWIRRLPKVENNWNALLQTLEGHSNSVYAVAFSPDSTVKLWDASSGAVLQTLEAGAVVQTLSFSDDGPSYKQTEDLYIPHFTPIAQLFLDRIFRTLSLSRSNR
jgi:WD40 repeat protein